MKEKEPETEVEISVIHETCVNCKARYINKPSWNMLLPNSTHPLGQAFLFLYDDILFLRQFLTM